MIAWRDKWERQGCHTTEHVVWNIRFSWLQEELWAGWCYWGFLKEAYRILVLIRKSCGALVFQVLSHRLLGIILCNGKLLSSPDAHQTDRSLAGYRIPDVVFTGQTTHDRQCFCSRCGKPKAFFGRRYGNYPQALVSPKAVITTTLTCRKE